MRKPATHQTFSAPLIAPALAVAAALPLAVFLWRFMVDDALISARYAAHIAAGVGYRFNTGAEVSDGVTPLGWAPLLSLAAGGGVLSAYRAAKVIGMVAWLLGAGCLGHAIERLGGHRARYLALLLVAGSAPLAAWSVAGMETGLVLGVAAVAVSARAVGHELVALGGAGLVAAWRPECAPWAIALALTPAREGKGLVRSRGRWRALGLAMGPFVVVAALRLAIFGRAAPLALLAKPSDLPHGLAYGAATFLLTGPIAAVAWQGLAPWVRGLQLAILAHWLALVFAGGDWMPLSRLAVPALPTVVLVAAAILARPHPEGWQKALSGARLALGLAGNIYLLVTVGPRAAAVEPKRLAVIDQLGEHLQGARAVATLDVGWVGAATAAPLLDLAGVTDLAVAALPGGHTTKPVPPALLERRGVDTLVLLLHADAPLDEPWTASRFSRRVEQHVADMPSMKERYRVVAVSEGPLRYVVLRRNDDGT